MCILGDSEKLLPNLPCLKPLDGRKSKKVEEYSKKNSLKQNSTNVENLTGHLSIVQGSRLNRFRLSERKAIAESTQLMYVAHWF